MTPDHPVWVNRLDGHMALANSAALRAAGVADARRRRRRAARSCATPRRADRRAQGQRDGARRREGAAAVRRDERSRARRRDAYVAAQGVTSVHHMGTWDELDVFARAWRARPADDAHLRRGAARNVGAAARRGRRETLRRPTDAATTGCGSARSRDSSTARSARTPRRSTSRSPTRRKRPRPASSTHAGRSLRLDLGRRQGRPARDRARDRRSRQRARCSTSSSASRARTARAIAASASSTRSTSPPPTSRASARSASSPSMQPYHAIDDGRWAEKVIGPERIKTTYAFRSLLDAGARAGLRQRLVRRAADAARGHLRRGDAAHARRQQSRRLGAGAEDHGRGGAARLHRAAAPTRRSRSGTRARSRPACSPTSR